MNILLTILLFTGMDLYFLKGSPDLLVRILPEVQVERATLYYSFSKTDWDSVTIEKQERFFNTVLRTPDTLNVVGVYCIYDNGTVDDDNGQPYLYEVKIFPRMLMPFSIKDLKVMIGQARKKIMSGVHVDEAITLLNYIDNMLRIVPVIKNSPNEAKRDLLRIEVQELRDQLGK
jgi:hypothetical protein